MVQLLVRDVPDYLIEGLKKKAAENGRSAEAEHRAILQQAISPQPQPHPFREEARRLREETVGWNLSDSADIIRESRDSNWSPSP